MAVISSVVVSSCGVTLAKEVAEKLGLRIGFYLACDWT